MADYTALTDLTGLAANQKAFLLPGGAKAVVQISSSAQSQSPWKAVPDSHLAVQVSVWQINDDGTPKLVNGNKVTPPAKNHAVLTSAIAEGTVVLSDSLTQMTMDALGRLSNWLVVQNQVSALLSASQQAAGQQLAASQAAAAAATAQAAMAAATAQASAAIAAASLAENSKG